MSNLQKAPKKVTGIVESVNINTPDLKAGERIEEGDLVYIDDKGKLRKIGPDLTVYVVETCSVTVNVGAPINADDYEIVHLKLDMSKKAGE